MASAISHAFMAVALGKIYCRQAMPWHFWAVSICCALLPDADAIGFVLGVPYEAPLGHRGLSHSLCFAAALGLGVASLAYRQAAPFSYAWCSLALYFAVVTAFHGVLDAITNAGLGVAFFAPFDNTRYFFPWRPVRVSPISITAFFSDRGLRILQSEIVFIWLPTLLAYAVLHGIRQHFFPLPQGR